MRLWMDLRFVFFFFVDDIYFVIYISCSILFVIFFKLRVHLSFVFLPNGLRKIYSHVQMYHIYCIIYRIASPVRKLNAHENASEWAHKKSTTNTNRQV